MKCSPPAKLEKTAKRMKDYATIRTKEKHEVNIYVCLSNGNKQKELKQ